MKGFRMVAVLLSLAMVGLACGGDESPLTADPDEPDEPTVQEESPLTDEPGAVEEAATPDPTPALEEPIPVERTQTVSAPSEVVEVGDMGNGMLVPVNSARMGEGWTQTEYHFGGEAVSYAATSELVPSGQWDAVEAAAAPYRSRMIVRRPPEAEFSGVVLVEWFNVTSGADIGPDWGFLSEEITREGHIWIGVSAQAVGINGQVGAFVGGGLIDTRGLKVIDPERYGDLDHPGDAFSFDIFSQAGATAAGADGVDVLGGLTPTHVIALGESQAAAFLTTYVNAVHPLVGLYDGFFIHSRGNLGPALSGERLTADVGAVRIRTDLDSPVFVYETETDLIGLGFLGARQANTESVHTWEVAGTAHADTYVIVHGAGLPRQPEVGALIGCDTPINDGPQHETAQAALHHLVRWVADGTPPPAAPPLDIAGEAIVRDQLGIAVGGVRTPPVDVPLRVLSGEPGPDGGACFLFGQTHPLAPEILAERYGTLDGYVAQLVASADAAVAAGWLLAVDAEVMVAEETARAEELLG